jgi:hypothetical protein
MKLERFLGGNLFLFVAIVFVVLGFGYFFQDVWKYLGVLGRFIIAIFFSGSFIVSAFLLRPKTNAIFSEALISIGFSGLFVTNFAIFIGFLYLFKIYNFVSYFCTWWILSSFNF